MPRPRAASLPRSVAIVHEDDDVLVVDKPAGLLTAIVNDGSHREGEPNLFSIVKDYVRGRRKGSPRVAWIVHRLDKEVSGLLVFAKNEHAFAWLKEDFRQKRVERIYAAVVEGQLDEDIAGAARRGVDVSLRRDSRGGVEGSIRSRLAEGRDRLMHSVPPPSARRRAAEEDGDDDTEDALDDSKLAVTHFRVVAAARGCSLLAVRLDTGRKNQIRVHCREIGHPIVGDRRFGSGDDPARRVCLHATTLAFRHPSSGAAMRFASPPPETVVRLVGMTSAAALERITAAMPASALPAASAGVAMAPTAAPTTTKATAPRAAPPERGWDHVAAWYDGLIGEQGSDHYGQVILPGALRLLAPQRDMRVLDLACGQGVLARRLAVLGVQTVGVDAAPRLVDLARRGAAGDALQRFEVGDARQLSIESLGGPASFDAVASVMALMNIEPLEPVLRAAATLLRPGGAFVAVMVHPAFRAPGQTSWGWDGEATEGQRDRRTTARARERKGRDPAPASRLTQFRRIDAYLSSSQHEIVMNPGAAASGAARVVTTTYHRPLQTYVKLLAAAGLLIEAIEEWPSMRQSQPGPRAQEENRARREIPMFVGIRAVRR